MIKKRMSERQKDRVKEVWENICFKIIWNIYI